MPLCLVNQNAALSDQGQMVSRVPPEFPVWLRCLGVLAGSPVGTTGRVAVFFERERAWEIMPTRSAFFYLCFSRSDGVLTVLN